MGIEIRGEAGMEEQSGHLCEPMGRGDPRAGRQEKGRRHGQGLAEKWASRLWSVDSTASLRTPRQAVLIVSGDDAQPRVRACGPRVSGSLGGCLKDSS